MKYFLAGYEIRDGEHEYSGFFIIEAENHQEATKIALQNEHDTNNYTNGWSEENKEKEAAYFDFQDGETAASNKSLTEITEEEMRFLQRVGVAYRK